MSEEETTVLILEDEQAVRESMADYLTDRGFQVLTAADGRTGLDLLREARPRLLLTDLRLPGVDGLTVLERSSEMRPGMPVVVVSGTGDIGDVIRALRLGAWDYLLKPIEDLSILAHIVNKTLERARLIAKERDYQANLEALVQQRTRELRESERRYRDLFERSLDAICMIDRHTGRNKDANDAMLRLTGRDRETFLRLTTREVAPKATEEQLHKIRDAQQALDLGNVVFLRPDGQERVARVSVIPLDEETTIAIARDITEELATAEHLRQTQKIEAIGSLAGGIAHDFNNILASILGYAELSLADLPPDNPVRNNVQAILTAGERARDLVARILAFSRGEETIKSSVRFDQVIREAVKLLRPAIPATIDIRQHIDAPGCVTGEPVRLQQIVMNLCTNAAHAMEATGGVLDLRLVQVSLKGSKAAVLQLTHGEYVKLSVADTGSGIPPQHLGRIFDPYFTTKEKGKGTGLGLAMVMGIAKSHGGTVTIESRVGQGSRFDVYLPMNATACSTVEPGRFLPACGSEHILVVDDEPAIVRVEKEMLTRLGYRVTPSEGPDQALEVFSRQPQDFDLVISDMTMPKMTGLRLAEKIRAIRPQARIIICSGYSEHISRVRDGAKPIDAFIRKPLNMAELGRTVRKVLDKA